MIKSVDNIKNIVSKYKHNRFDASLDWIEIIKSSENNFQFRNTQVFNILETNDVFKMQKLVDEYYEKVDILYGLVLNSIYIMGTSLNKYKNLESWNIFKNATVSKMKQEMHVYGYIDHLIMMRESVDAFLFELLDLPVNLNLITWSGELVLNVNWGDNLHDLCKVLMENGALPDCLDGSYLQGGVSEAFIHNAIIHKSLIEETFKIYPRVNVNIQDSIGMTPLHRLVCKKRRTSLIPVLKMFLENGADPTIPDHRGKSVFDYLGEDDGEMIGIINSHIRQS